MKKIGIVLFLLTAMTFIGCEMSYSTIGSVERKVAHAELTGATWVREDGSSIKYLGNGRAIVSGNNNASYEIVGDNGYILTYDNGYEFTGTWTVEKYEDYESLTVTIFFMGSQHPDATFIRPID